MSGQTVARPVEARQVFTTGQVAEICKVAGRTVCKWIDTGRLKGYRLPGGLDRRVSRGELIRFLADTGIPVPAALRPPAVVAYGLLPAELPAARHCDAFELGAVAQSSPITCAVIGDAEGISAATRAAQVVRDRYPNAVLILVCGEDVAPPVGRGWGRVIHRPVSPGTLATAVHSLIGAAE